MGDIPAARPSGERVYKALVGFRDQSRKPVYLLASHSHFYMENIFETPALKANGKASSRLDCRHGWGGALQAAQRRLRRQRNKTSTDIWLPQLQSTAQFSFRLKRRRSSAL